MVEELYPDLFSIRVPLPDSPLQYVNSYVIRAARRSLIIDTGFNCKASYNAITKGLTFLGIDLAHTDIFVTHFHADHFSLVPKLKTPTSRIYFNRPEAEILENWQGFGTMLDNAERQGFPSTKLQKALDAHPGSKFGVEWAPEAKLLSEGQELSYGRYTFTCVETPGHTLGHICLYESSQKIFISGDHVLKDITPNIQCWTDHENPLHRYMESLEKVRFLDVDLVLPGHRRRFNDLTARIDELISHHMDRLNEIRNILDKGPRTAFETAAKMNWDIQASNWDDFPIAQQWFATGEALSHLRYLEVNREIKAQSNGELIRFQLI